MKSAFSPSFRTPYVLQSSLNVEREIGKKLVVSGSYLYVSLRPRRTPDPRPRREPAAADQRKLPVFDQTGTQFLGTYYTWRRLLTGSSRARSTVRFRRV
jgi:hypothetical protein